MKLRICAVGRLRKGPEKALIDDYAVRADRTGRALGLGPLSIHEVDERKAVSQSDEADGLRRMCPSGARVVALDERGKTLSSPELAKTLAKWRDDGSAEACFLIGGADGLLPEIREAADLNLSFGRLVWPHMLARVMLAEQLYRATTILAGSPYHRA